MLSSLSKSYKMGKKGKFVSKNHKQKGGKNKNNLNSRRSCDRSFFELNSVNTSDEEEQEELSSIKINLTVNVTNDESDAKANELKRTRSTQTQDRVLEIKKPKLETDNKMSTKSTEMHRGFDTPRKSSKTSNSEYKTTDASEAQETQAAAQEKRDSYQSYRYTALRSRMTFDSGNRGSEGSVYKPTRKSSTEMLKGHNKSYEPRPKATPLSSHLIFKYDKQYENIKMVNEAKPSQPVPRPKAAAPEQFLDGSGNWRCAAL